MIRHIFKFIWNERKANSWIVLEYVLVFCILWFCCDYLYFIGKSYYEPLGFDIKNTYIIEMTSKDRHSATPYSEVRKLTRDENYSYAITLTERLKQYPGIEYVSFSSGDAPYSSSSSWWSFTINSDSIMQSFRVREVTSDFFNVFRINLTKGEIFDWTDPAHENHILISPDRNGYFGNSNISAYPISEVYNLGQTYEDSPSFTIIGATKCLKSSFIKPYENTVFRPLPKRQVSLSSEIAIRIHPNAAKGFEERFTKDMKNQLELGPYEFSSITSLVSRQEQTMRWSGITNNLKSVYSITSFLIINIFLGIIGTFWYRTESRKSEIGLRIAMGSSKRKIKSFLYTETILLLLISAIIGVNICINIGQTDFLSSLGIPKSNPELIGSGIEQHFINFGLTFLFLAVISLLAVWYPARQSSNMQPAEALHEE